MPREAPLDLLSDSDRFERHLPDALRADCDMTAGDGSIAAYVREWSRARIDAAVATLEEAGSLREQAGERNSTRTTRRSANV